MADARVMKEKEQETEVNEAQIAVHWKEEQYFHPSSKFIGQAYLTDPAVDQRFSEKNFPECFREYADLLSWDQYWHTTLDTSDAPFWKWFAGGKLNACLQLCRSSSGAVSEQSRIYFCGRAGRCSAGFHHVPGALLSCE